MAFSMAVCGLSKCSTEISTRVNKKLSRHIKNIIRYCLLLAVMQVLTSRECSSKSMMHLLHAVQ